MNKRGKHFICNFSYALSSNLLSFAISSLVILIVPKLIGVDEYGYWQVYIFYSSFIGFLHFGWNDGIYLRYGGIEYEKLDKKLFFSQFVMLFITQMVMALGISGFAFLYVKDKNRLFIIYMTAIALVIVNCRFLFLYILQSTNRIGMYARITILDRILYVSLIVLPLIIGIRNYRLMIVADLIGKIISLIAAMCACQEIAFRKISQFALTLNEAWLNLAVGIKLMLSNIASNLIVGLVKIGIERTWDIATFGKVSMTLSISNLVMFFINGIGIIMYPVLKRTRESSLPSIYRTLRDLLMVVLLGILIFYYPIKVVLSFWLPKYTDSLRYMIVLFPIVIFEGKMSLLINTYLKTLRKEKTILMVNVFTVILSALLTVFATLIFQDLNLAVISIVILLALRSVVSELILSKFMRIVVTKDIVLEFGMSIAFIIIAWTIDSGLSSLLYAILFIGYLHLKRNDIMESTTNLRALLKA